MALLLLDTKTEHSFTKMATMTLLLKIKTSNENWLSLNLAQTSN